MAAQDGIKLRNGQTALTPEELSFYDSLMMGLVIAGLWVTLLPAKGRFNGWWLLGAVLVGIGAAIKQPAIMAAYALPLMVRPWVNWSLREVAITAGRVLASFAVAIGSFCLVTLATGLGFGWINAVSVPGRAVNEMSASSVLSSAMV